MSERADQLHATADALIDLIASADESVLARPCPGREKLGDGTMGTIAAHTAENYQRIASFVAGGTSSSDRHAGGRHGRHGMPRWLRALRRGRSGDGHRGGAGRNEDGFAAATSCAELVERLKAGRGELARIAQLTDQQLDGVPPKDSFRFCDGERTLEQVLAGLLKHQGHQVQALQAALTPTQGLPEIADRAVDRRRNEAV